MAYGISLERDPDQGLDRYTITVGAGFDDDDARELGEWMDAAGQNPTAAFTIEVSEAADGDGRPLAALIARSARERVDVVRTRLGRAAGSYTAVAGSLLALV